MKDMHPRKWIVTYIEFIFVLKMQKIEQFRFADYVAYSQKTIS